MPRFENEAAGRLNGSAHRMIAPQPRTNAANAASAWQRLDPNRLPS